MDALILSCGTGGGHDAAARAIKEELIRRGNRAVMLNPYTLCSDKLAERINRIYISIAQNAPLCFGLIYKLGNVYRCLPFRSPVYHLNGKMVPIMEEYLNTHHYDVVIMSHLFPAEIMTQLKRQGKEIPKTIFVATDYTCIPFAEETECDAYITPSDKLEGDYIRRGVPPKKLFHFGIPVSAVFSDPIASSDAKAALGLDKDKKYLLIAGGSIGAGSRLRKTIGFLHKKCGDDIGLIVICGNNERLYRDLTESYGDSMVILKSTNKISLYMQASEIYLAKPGGLSSTEAAVMGIPLVHLPPIPGCESINASFFASNGMSMKISSKCADIEKVMVFIDDKAAQAKMRECQHAVIRSDAAGRICDLAEKMANTLPSVRQKA